MVVVVVSFENDGSLILTETDSNDHIFACSDPSSCKCI